MQRQWFSWQCRREEAVQTFPPAPAADLLRDSGQIVFLVSESGRAVTGFPCVP